MRVFADRVDDLLPDGQPLDPAPGGTLCKIGFAFIGAGSAGSHLLLRIEHDAPKPLTTAPDREFLDRLDLVYGPEVRPPLAGHLRHHGGNRGIDRLGRFVRLDRNLHPIRRISRPDRVMPCNLRVLPVRQGDLVIIGITMGAP